MVKKDAGSQIEKVYFFHSPLSTKRSCEYNAQQRGFVICAELSDIQGQKKLCRF